MFSIALCVVSLAVAYFAGRRSLVAGLAAVLGAGYLYGITRANLPETFSHFIFDAAVVGLYLARLGQRWSLQQRVVVQGLQLWVIALIAWPATLFLVPMQDPLVELVGLRGNVFLLPFLLIGALLDDEELYRLALWVSALNLMAAVFGGLQFVYGVEQFFPRSPVTDIIYRSKDVANWTAFRIPASFGSAHAYAGTMVMTMPLLLGAWVQKGRARAHRWLLMGAIAAALLGVFMGAARSHSVVLFLLLLVTTFSGSLKLAHRFRWVVVVGAIGWLVLSDPRLQRFMTLQDTESVSERIAYSVNVSFLELARDYPLGNGLAGGGTSIPYFWQNRLSHRVLVENEYARLALEQGIPGLLLWMTFILWAFSRRGPGRSDPWFLGRRLAWCAGAAYFVTGLLGTGLLTSIPQTCLLLMMTGWLASRSLDAWRRVGALQHPAMSPVPLTYYEPFANPSHH